MGFRLLCAPDGPGCLRLAAGSPADLFLLDISMPAIGGVEMDGIDVARQLRANGHGHTPIVMLSAHAPELSRDSQPGAAPYDAIMAKPLDIRKLTEIIGILLKLEWHFGGDIALPSRPPADAAGARDAMQPYIEELRYLAEIGFIRGIRESLARIATEAPRAKTLVARISAMTEALALTDIVRILDELDMHAQ
jgi:CheY-like chemotaxis protein